MENKRTTKVLLVVMILLAVVLAAIYAIELNGNVTRNDAIRIGAILPLSGNAAYVGEDIMNAMEIAKSDLQKEGIDLEIIYEDHEGNAAKATIAAQKLITQKIDSLFVAMSSPSAAVAPISEENKILTIVDSSADSPAIGREYVFKDYMSIYYDCKKLYSYGLNKGYKTAALLPEYESGQECSRGIKEIDSDAYIEIYTSNSNDFRTQITKLKEKGFEYVVLYGIKGDTIPIFKQMNELDYQPKLGCTFISVSCDIKELKNNSLLYSAVGTLSKTAITPEGIAYDQFLEKFTAKTGKNPVADFTVYTYDDIIILGRAINECNQNKECVKNKLAKLRNFNGAGGLLSFDSEGISERDTVIVGYDGGSFLPIN